jgi:hypothetical protein
MTTRTSSRILGKPPEFGPLPDTRKTTISPGEIINPQAKEDTSFFTRSKAKATPISAPVEGSKKVQVQPRPVITEEEVIPLTKDDMIRILSKKMPLETASITNKFMTKGNIKNQIIPSIYESFFFRKDIIHEFQRNLVNKITDDKMASFPLSTFNLYNKDDILNNTFYKPDRLGTRYTAKTGTYTRESKQNIKSVINLLSTKICSDIGGNYAKTAVKNTIDLVQNEENFDILVASTRIIENLSLPLEQRISQISAFIIVELGECKKYPGSYSINLICTDLKKAVPGTGSILMGAFLYTILSHPENTNLRRPVVFPEGNSLLKVTSKKLSDNSVIENAFFTTREPLIPVQQVAVLELANAYINPGGLCMYEKFGFTFDPTMFSNPSLGVECFNDRDNLPMQINFKIKPGYAELSIDERKEKVINITAGLDRGFPKSKICSLRDKRQKLLGYLKIIKLYIDNEPRASLKDYLPTSDEGKLINQLEIIQADSSTRKRVRGDSRPTNYMEQFIDYLENPTDPPNVVMEQKVNKLIKFLPEPPTTGGKLIRKTRKIRRYNKRYSRKMY